MSKAMAEIKALRGEPGKRKRFGIKRRRLGAWSPDQRATPRRLVMQNDGST